MNESNYSKPIFYNELREIEKERQQFFIDYFEELSPDKQRYLRKLVSKWFPRNIFEKREKNG